MKILPSDVDIATKQGICSPPALLYRQKRKRITSLSTNPNDGLPALHLLSWILTLLALKMKPATLIWIRPLKLGFFPTMDRHSPPIYPLPRNVCI